uniref:CSON005552 protein n=1 Tax=Culicoides sonorensis TaxID=179676 RepID=A0A336MVX4_CULSO
MILLIFFGTVLIVYLIQSFVLWKKSIKWADNIPGRKESIFYLMTLKAGLLAPEDRAEYVKKIVREYPRLLCYVFVNEIHVFANHPDLVKKVLTSPDCLKKSEDYRYVKWNHGVGVLLPQAWRVTRKHLQPAVGGKALQSFLPIFVECSQDFVKIVGQNLESKKEFDLLKISVQCTLDSICGE